MSSNLYAELLRERHMRPLLAAGGLARLPLAMNSFAVLLLVHERTGSFAAAGAVAGSLGAGYALVGPVYGRILDRVGQTSPLVVAAVVHTLANIALLWAAIGGSATGLLALLAVIAGAATPPVASSQRAVWPVLLGRRRDLLDTALAVDAMLLDVFIICGPLLVALLVSLASPAFALGAGAATMAVGTLWFAALEPSRSWQGETARPGPLGPLASAGVRTLVVTIAITGVALGGLTVALTGLADDVGGAALAGLLLAMLGAGSLSGGLLYGARSWAGSMQRRYSMLLAGFGVGLAPLLLASSLPAAIVLAVVGGLALAPVTACEFALIRAVAPVGTITEAYAWAITATFGGTAVGRVLAGGLVDGPGWRLAVLASAAALLAAGGIARLREVTLRDVSAGGRGG